MLTAALIPFVCSTSGRFLVSFVHKIFSAFQLELSLMSVL